MSTHRQPHGEVQVNPFQSVLRNNTWRDLEARSVSFDPIKVGKLAAKGFREPDGVGLLDSMINVARIEASPGTMEYVACIGRELSKETFGDFLRLVAPYKPDYTISRAGIIGDWQLPDIDTPRFFDLMKRHERLGNAWHLFMQNRVVFINALAEDGYGYIPSTTSVELLRSLPEPERLFLREGTSMRIADVNAFLNRPEMSVFYEDIARTLGHALVDTTVVRNEAVESNPVEGLLSLKRLERIRHLKRAFNQSGPEVKERVLQEYLNFAYQTLVLPTSTGSLMRFYAKKPDMVHGDYENISDGIWKVNMFRRSVYIEGTAELDRHDIMRYRFDLDSIGRGYFAIPFLHWTKGPDGQRVWHFDFISSDRLPPRMNLLLREEDRNKEVVNQNINWLAGLLALGYLSPDIVNTWLRKMSLPDKEVKQMMGPAQVPVLAIMMINDLLNSEILGRLERYADTGSV